MKSFLFAAFAVTLLLTSTVALASRENPTSLETLKMDKRFGIGVSAAGPLAIFGIEIDINVSEDFSLSGGIGTGMDYSTMSVKSRYYLLGKNVSPYIGLGMARWWSNSVASRDLAPSFLSRSFLPDDFRPENGFNVFMIYPVLGVQYLNVMGLEFSAEVMYLVKLMNMASSPYAGVGVHWYF